MFNLCDAFKSSAEPKHIGTRLMYEYLCCDD